MMKHFRIDYILGCILLFCVVTACQQKAETGEKAGVAISFDDRFIDEWYALRPMFQKYNAKVTFYITCGDSLKQDEIKKLKELQADGHEIGFHGTIHGKSTEMITLGAKQYTQMELSPGLSYMRAAGFQPTSYAHPGGNHNKQVDSVLHANGFKILRDVAISRRVFKGIPLYVLAPKIMNWIYYKFDHEGIVDALLIDQDSGITDQEMKDALVKAKDTNTALMLFGHEPLYAKPVGAEYGFNVSFLEMILKEANAQNLKFYTMTELVDAK